MPRSTLFAYMIFIKSNEINESYKLCQVRGKHTVGGTMFYKHLFLVMPPALKKLEGHIAFGLSVCLWVGGWVRLLTFER